MTKRDYFFGALAAIAVFGLILSYQNTALGQASNAPSVQTNAVDPLTITATTATLKAYATASSIASTAWFQYGTDPNSLTSKSDTTSINTTSYYQSTGGSPFYYIPVTGLLSNTTYYYQAVIQNSQGAGYGATLSFKTLPGSGVTVSPSPTATPTVGTGLTPTVTTKLPLSIVGTAVSLSGEVNMNGSAGQAWFEYGPTQALGMSTPQQSQTAGSAVAPYSYLLSNLMSRTTYYYRAVAQNQSGITRAPLAQFTTEGVGSILVSTPTPVPVVYRTVTTPAPPQVVYRTVTVPQTPQIVYRTVYQPQTVVSQPALNTGDAFSETNIQLQPPTPEQLSQFAAATQVAYARELPNVRTFASVSETASGFAGSEALTFILALVVIFLLVWVLTGRRT